MIDEREILFQEQKESSNVRSQIVLSHIEDFDNTLDSLSICNPLKNNDVIPIGILKTKKSSISMNNNQKRFCCEKSFGKSHINFTNYYFL